MTTHELAKKLLEMPDVPLGILTRGGEVMQAHENDIRMTNEKFWLRTEDGCEATTASHIVFHRS